MASAYRLIFPQGYTVPREIDSITTGRPLAEGIPLAEDLDEDLHQIEKAAAILSRNISFDE